MTHPTVCGLYSSVQPKPLPTLPLPSLPSSPPLFPPSPLPFHLTDALIATWREKGCGSFWKVVRHFPVLRSHIVCWKTCFVIHRAFRDGHPDVRPHLLYMQCTCTFTCACPMYVYMCMSNVHVRVRVHVQCMCTCNNSSKARQMESLKAVA